MGFVFLNVRFWGDQRVVLRQIKEIIKPNVYFNTKEIEEKEEAIDQLIKDLFKDEDEE